MSSIISDPKRTNFVAYKLYSHKYITIYSLHYCFDYAHGIIYIYIYFVKVSDRINNLLFLDISQLHSSVVASDGER